MDILSECEAQGREFNKPTTKKIVRSVTLTFEDYFSEQEQIAIENYKRGRVKGVGSVVFALLHPSDRLIQDILGRETFLALPTEEQVFLETLYTSLNKGTHGTQ